MSEIRLNQFVVHFERKIKQKCDICLSGFKFSKVQHICKRCFRSVCEQCAPFKNIVYAADNKNQPHRVCRKCNLESQILRKYVKNNHLKWGQDSDLVKLWMKKLGLQSIPRKRTGDKKKNRQYLNFNFLWKSLNFSFRQFIGITIDEAKVSQKDVAQLVNTALGEFATNKLADFPHLVYIVLFFLAHANLHNAVYFTTIIIQTIYTQQISLQNMHLFLEQLNCNQIEMYKMESIIQETFEKIVKRCTINVFTAQFSIELLGQILIKRQFQQVQKAIAFIFSQRKQFICQNANKPEQIFLDILRNSSSAGYRRALRQLDGQDSQRQSPQSRKSKSSSQSQNSDSLSKSSVSNRQKKKFEAQNQNLKIKIKQQQTQLDQLRRQNINYQIEINAIRQSERKAMEANFSKNLNQITFGKEKKNKKHEMSTSEQNDQLNFTTVIQKKNQEIVKLKKEIQIAKQVCHQVISNAKAIQSQKQGNLVDRKLLKEKDDQIQKLKQQSQSLKNTNKKLFNKLNELSTLIMDKEEKNIQEANKFFESLPDSLQKQSSKQKLKQCAIF